MRKGPAALATALATMAVMTLTGAASPAAAADVWKAKVRSGPEDVWQRAPGEVYEDGGSTVVRIDEVNDRLMLLAGHREPSKLRFRPNGSALTVEEPPCSHFTSFFFQGPVDWYENDQTITLGRIFLNCYQSPNLSYHVLAGALNFVNPGARDHCAVAVRNGDVIDIHIPPGCRSGVFRSDRNGSVWAGGSGFNIRLGVTFFKGPRTK